MKSTDPVFFFSSHYHDTTTACRQGKVKLIYIKSKCGHSILLYSQEFLRKKILTAGE
jgi:hypothetical protein